jgi:methyl-accepting chemotaxis protein
MKIIRRSIGAKVLILTSLCIILAFTGLFLANSWWQKNAMVHEITQFAERTSQLLQMSIEEPMAIGDNEATVSQFEKVSERYKDFKVYLTNHSGDITYATEKPSLRKDLAAVHALPEFTALLERSLKDKTQAGAFVEIDGVPYFVEVKSVANAPSCHHCHGSSKPILGSMVVFQDTSAEMATLASTQVKSALISLAGMVALLTVLLLFMKLTVVNRIKSIATCTEDISRGDLKARFDVGGQDELADLCRYLTDMVQRINDQLEYNKGVLSGIIIPMFVTDGREKIEYVNPPLLNILGLKEAQVLGSTPAEVFRAGETAAAIGEVLRTGQSRSGALKFARADGVTYPLHYEVSALRDSANRVVGAIGVMIDLSQEEQDKQRIERQQANLLEVARQVTEVAMKLSEAADALSTEMVELTQGVDATADRTTEVATAMEEMNATVIEVAQNASLTSEAAGAANDVAQKGSREVQESVAITREVAQTTNSLATTLGSLAEQATDIGRVLSVVNDIADQTNLLALNAAIEAARAGDAGRGFAVVADEVRKLAEKTMSATKEIDQVIIQIQQGTKAAVTEMDTARKRVDTATAMVEASGGMLHEIVGQSNRISDMVRNIATASEQQSSTSEEINNNINTINRVSQDNSQRIQKANGEIQDVARMAQDLSRLVSRFSEQEAERVKKERRRHTRLEVRVQGQEKACRLSRAGTSAWQAAQLVDISQSGARLRLTATALRPPLAGGEKVKLHSELKHGTYSLSDIAAEVVWLNGDILGIEFDELLPLGASELKRLVEP